MLLKRIYYWKGMKTDIYNYVKQYKLCQKLEFKPNVGTTMMFQQLQPIQPNSIHK